MDQSAQFQGSSDTVAQAVRRELIRVLFGSPSVPLINGVALLVTAGVLWPIFPLWISVTWLITGLCIVFVRLLLWWRFKKSKAEGNQIDRWAWRFTLATMAIGCQWGLLASTVLVAPQPIYYLFAAFVVGGLSAGSAMRNSPYPPAFYAFIGTAAPPMVVVLLLEGHLIAIAMGGLLLTFIVVMILVGRENHQHFAEYIRMKIEQEVLNADLKHATLHLTQQIEEKERIAHALQESSERFRAIGDNALDAIVISDGDGRVVYWNPAAERTFGFTAAESIGRSIHQIVAPSQKQEDAASGYSLFSASGQGEVLGKTIRLRALRKNGEEFPADLSVSSMKLGQVWHALGILRDVSDQERAMHAIEERQLELEEAQQLAHIGNWSFDPQTGTTTWSDELYRLFALDAAHAPPTLAEYEGLLAAESFANLSHAMQACLKSGLPFEIDLEFQPSGARGGWVSMRGEAREDAQGRRHLRGTCQDITARKGAEELARDQESMFRSLVEQNTSGIFIVSEDQSIAYLNPAALEMLGFPDAGQVIGQPVLRMVHNSDRERAESAMRDLFTGRERATEIAVAIRRSDGMTLDVLAKGAIATFKRRPAIITVLVDFTERRRAEDEIVKLNQQMADTLAVLQRRERDLTTLAQLSDLLQSCPATVAAYPIIGRMAATLFPRSSGSLAMRNAESLDFLWVETWGTDGSCMLTGLQPENCQALQEVRIIDDSDSVLPIQCPYRHARHGQTSVCIPLKIQGHTSGLVRLTLPGEIPFDDAMQQVLHSFASVVELSLANLQFRESLVEQALRDPLTGLFNRRYLMETLPREIRRAQRRGAPLTIAMLDIDHFKQLNDAHGHDAGDLILAELGALFVGALRADDIVCRYGGEEFLFLLPGCNLTMAKQRMSTIAFKVRKCTYTLRDIALPSITLSIGLAALTEGLSDCESLITAADQAMYAAKRMGRDQIACASPLSEESSATPTPCGAESDPESGQF